MLATAAVVGAGPSGQAISILLAQAGVDVTVFERAPAIEPVGAGLLVQPTGERVLRELGVAERLIDLAAPIDRLYGDTDRGRRVLDVRYADLAPGLVGRGLLRSAIASALLDRMRATGVRLITGTPISTTRPCAGADEVIDDHGRVHGPFDLVVIADGARSSLRATALEDDAVRRVRRYPWGTLWWIAPMTESLDETTLRQVYRGTRQMIGFLPSGRAAPESPAVVSCFWSLPVDDRSRPDRVDLEAWKRAAIALTPLAEGAVASVTDPSQLLFAQYFDVVIDRPWRGRAVVIGDAAHATSPQLGQGVNLGLADASELARQVLLDQPLESALAAYASRRRGPTRYYQQASRLLTPFFQSDATLLGTIRDACMGAACSFPPTRRQMLHALTGRKTGWLPSDRATPDANGRR